MLRVQDVPGMFFRGRKIFLEARADEDSSHPENKGLLMRDCLAFSLVTRQLVENEKGRTREKGLIINPN